MNKNKKLTNLLVGLSIMAVLGILFWLGRANINNLKNSANLPPSINSGLVSEINYYDFGTISMAAGDVKYDFRVKNNGLEPINIERIYTSCMCTLAEFIQNGKRTGPFGMPGHGFLPPLRKSIAPGEEVTIAVTFDPTAHGPAGVGPTEREIYLEGKSGLLLILRIGANVTP